ncbi:hypothetical protein ACFOZ7_13220 [Natribaculum luteum]|uniref:Uncharacterized protein n=1 Tax=Natribaculum luteum TaxID=1586232 RepID=A0ABD5P1C7_9EURY|nr:hypothetical protein [Natribaculum luteum]
MDRDDTSSGETVRPRATILSRSLLTWFELLIVGIVGGALGTVTSGPVPFVVYLATSLASVGIIFYNVDAMVADRLEE